jgi:hypothetical protein
MDWNAKDLFRFFLRRLAKSQLEGLARAAISPDLDLHLADRGGTRIERVVTVVLAVLSQRVLRDPSECFTCTCKATGNLGSTWER